jgi:hypothetical protein
MNLFFRITGVIIGLVLSFFTLFYLFIVVGLGSGLDSSIGGLVLAYILVSLPFLFSFWIVYRCLCIGEMAHWEILTREVRPKALLRAVMAEVCMLMVVFLLGKAYEFHIRDFPVLVEERPPLAEIRDAGYRPRLPLFSPAVGIEAPDGKFTPMLFLDWPPPGWGFEDLTFDLKAGLPEIKVYRGTNEIAASNQFLGKFQIAGYSTKPSLDVMLLFELSEKKQLLMIARDGNKTPLKLLRVDPPAGK